jgi:hypothetical protein
MSLYIAYRCLSVMQDGGYRNGVSVPFIYDFGDMLGSTGSAGSHDR